MYRGICFERFYTCAVQTTWALLLSGTLVGLANASQMDCSERFDFTGYVRADSALSERKPALIRIQGPKRPPGTGFLVDAERGLVITAYHVVEGATKSKSRSKSTDTKSKESSPLEIVGVPASAHRGNVKMELLVEDKIHDVAVLQLVPHDSLRGEKPLQISVDRVNEKQEFSYGGYREALDKGELPSALVVQGRLDKVYLEDGRLEYRGASNVFPGMSGSPIVDYRGLVVGLVTRAVGTDLFIGIAVRDFAETLLDPDIPRSPDVGHLREQFMALSEADSGENLLQLVRTDRDQIINNLAYIQFLGELATNGVPTQLRKFIDCPIYKAATDRGLEKAAEWISPWLPDHRPSVKYAQEAEAMAQKFYSDGYWEIAEQFWEKAETFYAHAIKNYAWNRPSGLVFLCSSGPSSKVSFAEEMQYKLRRFELPADTVPQSRLKDVHACYGATKDNELGRLLKEHTEVRYKLAQVNHKPNTYDSIKEEIKLASFISTGNAYIVNVEFLGDILQANGEYEDASKAYATVWREGNSTKEIEAKFQAVRAKEPAPINSFRNSIRTAPGLDHLWFQKESSQPR